MRKKKRKNNILNEQLASAYTYPMSGLLIELNSSTYTYEHSLDNGS